MPLQTPTPDGVLELFRDEIIPRPGEIEAEYESIVAESAGLSWDRPFPGVELLRVPGRPTLIRVDYRRTINRGAYDEGDRIRHELRNLWNDIRAAIPSEAQAEFLTPQMTHVDTSNGLEVACHAHGIVRAF